MTAEEIIAFEKEVAELFNSGIIKAPIHLDGGNEEQLVEIFKDVGPNDWICGSWRMHAKCLLAGVPKETLRDAICAGSSITLCFPEYRIISSAIVGGILPIALGIAWSIRRSGGSEKVFCFLGDMTACTGMFAECLEYAVNFDLPITYVIEDNGKSVCTPTEEVWGTRVGKKFMMRHIASGKLQAFLYTLPFPHSGAGKRVNF